MDFHDVQQGGMAGLSCGIISPAETLIARGLVGINGPIVCLFVQGQPIVPVEIEDQKQVEAALRDREQELSQLVNMVPGHLWRLTPDGEPTFFNKRMVDFLGLDVPDTDKSGMTRLDAVIETIHPDDAAEFKTTLMRCLGTGQRFTMRHRLRRADGVYRWMSSRAEPMRDEGGRIVQWYGLCHDIDDQVHAEEALRRASDKLAQATFPMIVAAGPIPRYGSSYL